MKKLLAMTSVFCMSASLLGGCTPVAKGTNILDVNENPATGGKYKHYKVTDITEGQMTLHAQNALQARVQSIAGRQANVFTAGNNALVVLGEPNTPAGTSSTHNPPGPIPPGTGQHGYVDTIFGTGIPYTGARFGTNTGTPSYGPNTLNDNGGRNGAAPAPSVRTRVNTVDYGATPNGTVIRTTPQQFQQNKLGLVGTSHVSNNVPPDVKSYIQAVIKKANPSIQNVYFLVR